MTTHSAECEKARFGGSFQHTLPFPDSGIDYWPKMGKLSPEQREDVLACPHRSHDSVRWLWRVR